MTSRRRHTVGDALVKAAMLAAFVGWLVVCIAAILIMVR